MRAAVLGSPIAHSMSPVLHRAAYAALGLGWSYEAIEVKAGSLAEFLARLDGSWAGLSLTMPLKREVMPLLDSADPLVQEVGSANTVVLAGGRRRGYNTDVAGVVAALAEAGVTAAAGTVVLGCGATAAAVLAALAQLGDRNPVLAARSHPADTLAAAARLGVKPTLAPLAAAEIRGAELVISTLPPRVADPLAPAVGGARVLLDVTYQPWPSALAAACPGTVIGGLALLLHQAAEQVRLMTGQPAPLAVMRAALKPPPAPADGGSGGS